MITVRDLPDDNDSDFITKALVEFYKNKRLEKHAGEVADTYKSELMEVIEEACDPESGEYEDGWVDEKGSQYLKLPEVVEDPIKHREITTIKREKRTSQSLNEDRALALLGEKELLEGCIEYVPVLNEDAVLALNYTEQLTDDELKSLYDEKITWAFVQVEG